MKTVKTTKSKTTKPAVKTTAKKAVPKATNAKALKATTAIVRPESAKVKPVKTKVAAEPMTTPSRREISSDLIATRAYIIWEQQGRPQGHDLANWLLAENQLKQEQSFTA